MAVNYSPDEVAFILIDYKGGGLADAFVDEKKGIHLPHVVGTITNLDGAAIQRSLMSINSELKRRQEVFKKAKSETNEGTMDIYDYQKLYRNKVVSEPMPHLFIISDEFAELKKQQPEFMDELISTARIGRSLGVHLILATQKPSGVVNEQIWSNTKFRICLRVAEKSDSMEMLKRPEAAEIKNTGRFYLQVGYNELFAMGQSAWCGAPYIPQDDVVIDEDKSVSFIDGIGQTVINIKPQPKKVYDVEGKQIVSIVKYLSDIAKKEKIVPKRLWCPPLEPFIELKNLLDSYQGKENEMSSVIGLVDDPKKQRQFVYAINLHSFHHMLVCGLSGSGKSCFLKTMLFSLVYRYSPEDINYYILDMSGGSLSGFSKLPHCGAYITENNEAEFERLLSLIEEIVIERKNLFAKEEVDSFYAYTQHKKMSVILFVIDNFPMINNNFKNGTTYYSSLHEYMKKCSSCGIKFIITSNHFNEVHSNTRQEMDYRVAFQAKDKYDYTDILGIRCDFTIPQISGRGICSINEQPFEFHVALLDAKQKELEKNNLLKSYVNTLISNYSSSNPARKLAMSDDSETYKNFTNRFSVDRIPLGYSIKDMKKVAIPFKQLHCMSVYFGNSIGVKPILSNFVFAAKYNQMNLIVVKKNYNSAFDSEEIRSELSDLTNVTLYEATQQGFELLNSHIKNEIVSRNVFRDEYCKNNNIPQTDKSRVLKARNYIRSKTTPLLVLIEGFADICSIEKNDDFQAVEASFKVFIERTKGYNIYFVGTFYPEDYTNVKSSELMESFIKEQFCLLFGGCYNKQSIVDSLPIDYRSIDKPIPKYDRFIMKYKDEFHLLRMPCGKLESENIDPDEASII